MLETNAIPGVTVAICCHNSAARLPSTLAHLAAQKAPLDLKWEVLVIDNASSDDTAGTAQRCWTESATAPLRVVREPRPGLVFARECAFQQARHEFVSFIDDDNWVCAEWVEAVFKIMSQHPDIGVCGSVNEPVCEVTPPWWFDQFKTVLAVTTNDAPQGDVTALDAVVAGAGMTVRLSAWRELVAKGFSPLLTGRKGKTLMAGEDSEICLVIKLAGWRLWRDPQLRLQHYLPAGRLDWNYVRRLYRGYGESSVWLDGYQFFEGGQEPHWKQPLRRLWLWHLLASAGAILRHPYKFVKGLWDPLEGDADIVLLELQLGRIIGFIHGYKRYGAAKQTIRELFGGQAAARAARESSWAG